MNISQENSKPDDINMVDDILYERRNVSDLRWAAREWKEASKYKYKKVLTNSQLYSLVVKSDRVVSAIEKLIAEGHEHKVLIKRVNEILDDMSHTLDIGEIRKFALSLPKIMKRIYNKILVNPSGIKRLKEVIPETPVLLLPTHRSYADFLLISYLAFHYEFSFPVIAAGMDFMSMSIIGDMLRGSGAFYIRRSFMDDKLYWAVFQEYVQALLLKSGQPMEFFLEGTRSRTGKSLHPKIGLLSCVTECWLRGKVPDIQIVPVSISYNRTLEETLYAYEMLGVPKPKESTSGLLKAMKILKENFGNIYIHFGTPFSMSEFLSPRVQRHLHVSPDHLTPLSLTERQACESLGLRVLRELQSNCVISVWSLACICFLRTLWQGLWSIPWDTLQMETIELSNLVQKLSSRTEGSDSNEEFKCHLERSVNDHKHTVTMKGTDVLIVRVMNPDQFNTKKPLLTLQHSTIECAVTHLLLQYYVNQTMHLFIRPALVSSALESYSQKRVPMRFLRSRFSLLITIFSFDFIFEPEEESKDLEKSLELLREYNCIRLHPEEIEVLDCSVTMGSFLYQRKSLLQFFSELIRPFVLSYQVAVNVASSLPAWTSESSIVSAIQKEMEASTVVTLLYSALSLDSCRNAVKMLLKMEALTKGKTSTNALELVPNEKCMSCIKEILRPTLVPSDLLQPKL